MDLSWNELNEREDNKKKEEKKMETFRKLQLLWPWRTEASVGVGRRRRAIWLRRWCEGHRIWFDFSISTKEINGEAERADEVRNRKCGWNFPAFRILASSSSDADVAYSSSTVGHQSKTQSKFSLLRPSIQFHPISSANIVQYI